MPRRILDQIQAAIRNATYDMTVHAMEEMAEDDLDLTAVEMSILTGKLIRRERHDIRGTRYTVQGTGTDGLITVKTIGRFTEFGRYLIITVYRVEESNP
jgi:hypothetical protein